MSANDVEASPDYLRAVRAFQDAFGCYFPDVAGDLDRAAIEFEWLESRVFGNPLETVRRSQAKADLRRLETFLRADHAVPYWLPMNGQLAIADALHGPDPIRAHQKTILDFLLALGGMESEPVIKDRVVDAFVAHAAACIEQIPDTRNVNWEAVHAVDGLRTLWRRNTGKDGPARALNPAAKFADFLRDGFDWLEVEADPISAFRRWVATKGE